MMATPAKAQPSASSRTLGARERAARFCQRFGLRVPILQAPNITFVPTASGFLYLAVVLEARRP